SPRFLPPPPAGRQARALRGEGRGGGGRILNNAIDAARTHRDPRTRITPHPNPPPQGGRGYKGEWPTCVDALTVRRYDGRRNDGFRDSSNSGNLLDPTRLHDRLDEIRNLEPGLHLRFQARLRRLDPAETAEHIGGLGQRHDDDSVAIAHHDIPGVHPHPAE